MSLNAAERRRTAEELRANLARSGSTPEQVAAGLGFTAQRLQSSLDVDPAGDPVDVWQLRDHLDRAIRDAGGVPVAWTVLTEPARQMARNWFDLR